MSVLNYITLSHLKKVVAGIAQKFKEVEDTVTNKTTEIEKNVNTQLLEVNNHFQTVDKDIEDLKDGDYLDGKLITKGSSTESEIFNGKDSMNIASGDYSHAEGLGSVASGYASHAEGGYGPNLASDAYFIKVKYWQTTQYTDGIKFIYQIIEDNSKGNIGNLNLESYEGLYLRANNTEHYVKIIEGPSTVFSTQGRLNCITVNETLTVSTDVTTIFFHSFTIASGKGSHSEGHYTVALGDYSHAEGDKTTASGVGSHVEGLSTKATTNYSHAEGNGTTSSNVYSHAEGTDTIASGNSSHAEGQLTTAQEAASHAEGYNTIASSTYSHAEGQLTTASGSCSHAEGSNTTASGTFSHAEGSSTEASGQWSHAEGFSTLASGSNSHAEGRNTIASGAYSHAEGFFSKSTRSSHAEGEHTVASGSGSHAEGCGNYTYVEFFKLSLTGEANATSYTVTSVTKCKIPDKIIIGAMRVASDSTITAVNRNSNDNSIISITVNKTLSSNALNNSSISFSKQNIASGLGSHVEGANTEAKGKYAHSEGFWTLAEGEASHTEGRATVASYADQHVEGRYNIPGDYAHIVGNGYVDQSEKNVTQSNAYTLDWNGNGTYAGKLTIGAAPTNDMDVATKKYVDDNTGGTNADWEESDSTDSSYILNKPSIKAGTGESSIVEGVIEQPSSSGIYTLYLTGDANATTYSYTCEDTIPTTSLWEFIKYNNNFYIVDGVAYNGSVTVTKTLSSSALNNVEVTLYRYYKDALGKGSHAEGYITFAAKNYSHAEGIAKAIGICSHAENGSGSIAMGSYSHSENSGIAYGNYTHAEGMGTIAETESQHVQGKYNLADVNGIYAHIVGNGTYENRSNAHTLDWSGNGWYAGKLTVGTGPTANMDVATKQYVDNNVPIPSSITPYTDYENGEIGTSTAYARADHIHPSDNSKVNVMSSGIGNGRFVFQQGAFDEDELFVGYIDSSQNHYGLSVGWDDYVRLHGLSDPISDDDAATKKYVDDSIPIVPTKISDLTNDSGFITSYTETDPIFVASAAHGITASDISNWNSKTSLTLGTTSSTAFRGDYGQSAYTHAVTNKGSAFSSGLYKITTNSEGHVTAATSVEKSDITGLGIPAQDTTYTFDGTYNASTNKAATVSTVTNAVSGKANSSDVLTKTNTTSYTPSADYHPATKKYVDDATAGITTDLSGLTDTIISSPSDGQLLKYNATTSKWENVTLSLAINNNVIQLKEGNTVISSVTLPVYNGGVSS